MTIKYQIVVGRAVGLLVSEEKLYKLLGWLVGTFEPRIMVGMQRERCNSKNRSIGNGVKKFCSDVIVRGVLVCNVGCRCWHAQIILEVDEL